MIVLGLWCSTEVMVQQLLLYVLHLPALMQKEVQIQTCCVQLDLKPAEDVLERDNCFSSLKLPYTAKISTSVLEMTSSTADLATLKLSQLLLCSQRKKG